METDADDDAIALSNSLQTMSLEASSLPQSIAVEIPTSSYSQQKAESTPTKSNKNPNGPSRRSSAYGTKPMSSPVLNRKSSSTFSKSATSPKLSRTSSGPHSFRPLNRDDGTHLVQDDQQRAIDASQIATEFLKKELAFHGTQGILAETVVFLHDACYGHRYSRPKVSKSTLSLIVERPERLQASVNGVAAAYVRLKELHAHGREPPHPHRDPSPILPFSIKKSVRVTPLDAPAVTAVHGSKWMQELNAMCDLAESRLKSTGKELNRVEDQAIGAQSSKPKLHEGDLYLCRESLDAFQGALGGVLDAVDAVFANDPKHAKTNRAFVGIRPPGHHCSADIPSGFCWLNNVHVGIEHAAQMHALTHAAIIDFDLHHGDGSQSITWERNVKASKVPKNASLSRKTSIGYFSLHDINSYPCEYGDEEKIQRASLCIENAHGQSIWNVHLQPWKTIEEFWTLYESRYLVLLEKARLFLRTQSQRFRSLGSSVHPKGAIFISAGFDASEWEGEGMQRHKVNVPTAFYARFTSDIVKLAKEEETTVEGRVISVLEGGYSDRALMSGVLSHIVGLTDSRQESDIHPNAQTFNGSEEAGPRNDREIGSKLPDDWWDSKNLEELEERLKPRPPPPPPEKPRSTEAPTYTSPTQSFTAKIVDPSKIFRSSSGSSQIPMDEVSAAPPTPPEVDWATASVEFAKLLIPNNRQINSCKHEDLAEVRPRRQRHSSIGLPSVESLPEPKMQLRRGRGKVTPTSETTEMNLRPQSRRRSESDRRKTMGDVLTGTGETESFLKDKTMDQDDRPSTAGSTSYAIMNEPIADKVNARDSQSALQIKKSPADNLNIVKARRSSQGKVDLKQTKSAPKKAPSQKAPVKQVVVLPTQTASTSFGSDSRLNTDGSANVESLTQGVKRITLKMPSTDSVETNNAKDGASVMENVPSKPARKPPAARNTKPTGAKAPKGRPSKDRQAEIAPLRTDQNITVSSTPDNRTEDQDATTKFSEVENLEKSAIQPPPSPRPTFAVPSGMPSDFTQGTVAVLPNVLSSNLIDAYEVPVTSEEALMQTKIEPIEDQEKLNDFEELRYADNIGSTFPVQGQEEILDEFIPYIPPSGDAMDSSTKQTQPPISLTWLPPNTGTPVQTPGKRKEELPVFTASSHIPFAISTEKTDAMDLGDAQKENSNVANKFMSQPRQVGHTMDSGFENHHDIWEVPDTPRG